MTLNIFKASKETFDEMQGKDFIPNANEGVVYIKVVGLKPDTIKNKSPNDVINNAEGIVMAGDLTEIKGQINTWLDELITEYSRKEA